MARIINVGGGPTRSLPPIYNGWTQDLLDIDKQVKPDICCDAKKMGTLKKAQYDAVYCSHNLEHFYLHDVPVVLAGFKHVLKPDGFAHIAVPDIQALLEAVVAGKHDLMDTWYVSGGGPIRYHDVLYGWGKAMAEGNLYYAHKCGFTAKSFTKVLRDAGFPFLFLSQDGYNLEVFAFTSNPTARRRKELGLPCR